MKDIEKCREMLRKDDWKSNKWKINNVEKWKDILKWVKVERKKERGGIDEKIGKGKLREVESDWVKERMKEEDEGDMRNEDKVGGEKKKMILWKNVLEKGG